MAKFTTTITDEAIKKQANAIATNQSFTFTKMRVGNIDVPVIPKYEDKDTVRVMARVDNQTLTGDLKVNTLQLYAKVGSEAEFVFARCTAVEPDIIPAKDKGHVVATYVLNTKLSRDGKLTIEYANLDGEVASQKDFFEYKKVVDKAINDFTSALGVDFEKHKTAVQRQAKTVENKLKTTPWVNLALENGATGVVRTRFVNGIPYIQIKRLKSKQTQFSHISGDIKSILGNQDMAIICANNLRDKAYYVNVSAAGGLWLDTNGGTSGLEVSSPPTPLI